MLVAPVAITCVVTLKSATGTDAGGVTVLGGDVAGAPGGTAGAAVEGGFEPEEESDEPPPQAASSRGRDSSKGSARAGIRRDNAGKGIFENIVLIFAVDAQAMARAVLQATE